MKNAILTLSAFILFTACANEGKKVVEKTAHVYGNCEKCKATIEKAAKINGTSEVSWSPDSKLLKYKIDTTITSTEAVLKSIAAAGYDNELYQGNDYEYQKLPDCCHYERKDH
jgi:copper chaperone CopZ